LESVMSESRILRSIATLGFTLALFGCAEGEPGPTRPRDSLQARIVQEAQELHGVDAVFDSIAAIVPSFAGAYFRKGVAIIALTDAAAKAEATREVANVLRSRMRCKSAVLCESLTQHEFDVTLVKTPWRTLVAARNQIVDDSAFARALILDINEESNTVDIGAYSTEDSIEFVKRLSTRGIASGVARIVPGKRAEPTQYTLNTRLRPIHGGALIGPRGCTLAVVGILNGMARAITNSHCTAVRFELDFQATSQPFGGVQWGAEIADPAPYRCGPFFSRKWCRRADVAAYSTDNIDVNPGEMPFVIGSIALPTERHWGLDQIVGTLDIGSAAPIVATQEYLLQGELVERVGITTGWQAGLVTNTCADVWYGNIGIRIVCADYAQTFARPGDSGGPLFRMVNGDPSQLIFIGINHGRDENSGASGISSNYRQMKQDLPGLCFWYGC
jgi:hypothetical protein